MPVVDQKAAFAERVRRINSGGQFEHQDIVGYRTQKLYEMKAGPKLKQRRQRTFADRVMVVVAFLSGIAAVLLGRLAYFYMSRIEGMPEAFVTLGGKGMLLSALVVATSLAALLHLSTKGRMPALILGCGLMYFGESAVAATAPEVWGELFSPDYVAAVAGGVPGLALTTG